MDIEALQLKRIIGNFNNYKGEVFEDGEPIFVEDPNSRGANSFPFFVIGDGKSTLKELINTGKIFISLSESNNNIERIINEYTISQGSQPPNDVSAEGGSQGQSKYISRVDHKHYLSKQTIDDVLSLEHIPEGTSKDTLTDISKFKCRRVMAGTGTPPTTGAITGDIYIKYE